MEKYRIRLANGRVVGPFIDEQISELYSKGHIDGSEECQVFPGGEWSSLRNFKELSKLLAKPQRTSTQENSTVIRKLSVLTSKESSAEEKPEREQATKTQTIKEIEENTGSIEKVPEVSLDTEDNENFPKEFSYNKMAKNDPSRSDIKLPPPKKESTVDKTAMNKVEKTTVDDDSADKTVLNISSKELMARLRAEKEALDKKRAQEELEKKNNPVKEITRSIQKEVEVFDADQSTQMISLTGIRDDLKKELIHSENDFELEAREIEKKKIREKKEDEEKLPKLEAKVEKVEPKKKTKTILIVLVLGALAIFLFPEEQKKESTKIVPFVPRLEFPVPFKVEDGEQSDLLKKQAIELYNKGDLYSKHLASQVFRKSLELKFHDNDAIYRMILVYTELLDDDTNDIVSGNEIFKLIQIAKGKGLSDLNLAMGTATYFIHFKKYGAAIKILEDYLTLYKKISPKFLAIYADALSLSGNLPKAKAIVEKILAVKDKTEENYEALARFAMFENEYSDMQKYVTEGLTKFPKSVGLLVIQGDLAIHEGNFKLLPSIVEKIKSLKAEQSRRYLAKYYEFKGIILAAQKKNKEAAEYFKEALKLKESPELRSKLATLDSTNTGDSVDQLISISKSVDFMNKSREAARKRNWELAMTQALEATDAAPKYFPAKILFSQLQIKQGYFKEAIQTLLTLAQEFPNEREITFSLISAYVESFKFKDAIRYLDGLAATETRTTPAYYSAMGRYYVKSNDYFQAITWLQKSINANPIFDEDYYLLAQTYLKNRTYAKAKIILLKAMDLDPTNIDYKVAFSKILYEMQDADTAIGFILGCLESSPGDPVLMSEIAIYYYRSGQQKYFEEYKKKLEELPERSRNLYSFLIKAAQIDDKIEDVIKYSHELLKIEPGDLETRMNLATTLAESKKFPEALAELDFIEQRLPTYPKVMYLKSKIMQETGDIDKAIKIAESELKSNPQSEEGNVLLGIIYTNSTKKDYAKAQNYYKEAQKINPKSIEALLGLAYINFEKNNVETALDLYSKVTKLDPNNGYAHKQLGFTYKLMGQGALAVESFNAYLQIEPDAKDKDKIKGYINELQ